MSTAATGTGTGTLPSSSSTTTSDLSPIATPSQSISQTQHVAPPHPHVSVPAASTTNHHAAPVTSTNTNTNTGSGNGTITKTSTSTSTSTPGKRGPSPSIRYVQERVDSDCASFLISHFVDDGMALYHDLDAYKPVITNMPTAIPVEDSTPPHGVFYVAYVNEQPAACGGLIPIKSHTESRVLEMKRIWVEPWARKRGLARGMIRVLESWACAHDYRAIWLQTSTRRPDASALYVSDGYVIIPGFEPPFHPEMALFYGKTLPHTESTSTSTSSSTSTSLSPSTSCSPSPSPCSSSRVRYDIERDSPSSRLILSHFLCQSDALHADLDPVILQRNAASVFPDDMIPPHGIFYVVYVDGQPAACAGARPLEKHQKLTITPPKRIAEIKRVWVEPWARGRGIARGLLCSLERWARSCGYRAVWLGTSARQVEAVAMYPACGYAPIPAFEPLFDDKLALFFGKDLDGLDKDKDQHTNNNATKHAQDQINNIPQQH